MKKLALIAVLTGAMLCGCTGSAGNNLGRIMDMDYNNRDYNDMYYGTNGKYYDDRCIFDNGYGYTNSTGTKYGDDSGYGGLNRSYSTNEYSTMDNK